MQNISTPLGKKNTNHFLQSKTNTLVSGEDTIWLVINSDKHGLVHFEQFMEFIKRTWCISNSKFVNIHIALSEAVMNAIDHGNKRHPEKTIYICAKRDEDYFGFSVEDQGEGFNYRRIENPTDHENREKAHGRGIFIMNYLTENLHYSENGTCAKLLFSRT